MTVEEASIGGLGAHVLTMASDTGLIDAGLKLRTMRLPDRFQDQDKPENAICRAGPGRRRDRRDGAEGAPAQQRRGDRGGAGLSRPGRGRRACVLRCHNAGMVRSAAS